MYHLSRHSDKVERCTLRICGRGVKGTRTTDDEYRKGISACFILRPSSLASRFAQKRNVCVYAIAQPLSEFYSIFFGCYMQISLRVLSMDAAHVSTTDCTGFILPLNNVYIAYDIRTSFCIFFYIAAVNSITFLRCELQ